MKNIISLVLVLFFYSCESDPIQTPLDNGVEFEQHIFKLDHSLQSHQNIPSTINTAFSELLFSGILLDSVANIEKDTVRALVSIDLNKFFEYEYQICTSVVSVEVPTISLFSNSDLSDIVDSGNLKIKLLSSANNYIEEDSIHWVNHGQHLLNELGVCENAINEECNILDYDISDNSENELIVTLPETFLSPSFNSILCENSHINLVIEYLPEESDDIQYVEWYSSDFSNEYSFTPKFNLDYIKMELVDTTEYQFILEGISSINQNYYYINDDLSSDWSTMYFANIRDSIAGTVDSLIDFNQVFIEEPIVSNQNLSTKFDLGTVKIKLNDNAINQASIDNILFELQNIRAYIDASDPSGDNYDGNDTMLTDGNLQYDILYNSVGDIISREKFNDFGVDNCENKYEDGLQDCCNEMQECVYNDQGTENNGVLNWVDNNNDGLWDEEDIGEGWSDVGKDGCLDNYEVGTPEAPECLVFPNTEYVAGTDPHGDNYNPDPEGDDYPNNILGTEGNGVLDWNDNNNNNMWDDGEGELWLDYGLDGIPNTYDLGEGDNQFNLSYEYFFDYGLDNLPSESEEGYCGIKNLCTQLNSQYDLGEIDEDVGQDGCSDEYEIGTPEVPECSIFPSIEYVEGSDPHGDNYNIDPNGDNYSSAQDSGTEGNGLLDEGEQWFDYGLDQTQDIYEQFLPENQIVVSSNPDSHEIDIDNFITYSQNEIPELGSSKVAIWISSITYNQAEDIYELTISIYSERQLNGVKFSLGHPEPGSNLQATWSDNYERHYVQNVSWHDYEGDDGNIVYEKMFEDFSIYNLQDIAAYSNLISDTLVAINYGYDIFCKIDSDDFKTFLDNYSSGIVSRSNSKIVIPIDTALTDLNSSSLRVDLDLVSDVQEQTYSSSSIYESSLDLSYGFRVIDESDVNLEIKIGDLIQYHIVKGIPFEGFLLKGNSLNNFKSIYLRNNDAYIYMVVEK